jgi:hypothetical protein
MAELPWRGRAADRPEGLALPPESMPPMRGARPRKRWRYVGLYGAEVMLCVGSACVGPLRQSWWAVWDRRAGQLRERTAMGRAGVALTEGVVAVRGRGIQLDLILDEGDGVEVVSPTSRGHYIWTRKRLASATGELVLDGQRHPVSAPALIDDSDGYHDRRTAWCWSAGTGVSVDGESIAWNLVTGIHDAARQSERTVWIAGRPHEVAPVAFAPDLSSVRFAEGSELTFHGEATRHRAENRLVIRSRYEQPFGTFTGTLPGGFVLANGFGVMERHLAFW